MRFTHQKPSLTHRKPPMTIISCPFLTANRGGTQPSKCHDCWSWKGENIKRWRPAAGKKVATLYMAQDKGSIHFLDVIVLNLARPAPYTSQAQSTSLQPIVLDRRASNWLILDWQSSGSQHGHADSLTAGTYKQSLTIVDWDQWKMIACRSAIDERRL